jgi:hypothetical protein
VVLDYLRNRREVHHGRMLLMLHALVAMSSEAGDDTTLRTVNVRFDACPLRGCFPFLRLQATMRALTSSALSPRPLHDISLYVSFAGVPDSPVPFVAVELLTVDDDDMSHAMQPATAAAVDAAAAAAAGHGATGGGAARPRAGDDDEDEGHGRAAAAAAAARKSVKPDITASVIPLVEPPTYSRTPLGLLVRQPRLCVFVCLWQYPLTRHAAVPARERPHALQPATGPDAAAGAFPARRQRDAPQPRQRREHGGARSGRSEQGGCCAY